MFTTVLSAAAARWLREHHHAATTAELRRLGLGRCAVDRLVRLGVLLRVARGVYITADAPLTLEHHCRVLSCTYPSGFVTGPTAAMLERLRRQPFAAALHWCVPHGIHLEPARGVLFRQSTKVDDRDRIRRSDGITIASRPRLAFDTARDMRPLDHRSMVHQMRDLELVRDEDLLAIGDRLCHPARRGSSTFRLTLMDLGHPPPDSHPEVVLGDALLRRGVPVEPQYKVAASGERSQHPDLAVPAVRWAVELDIHPEHRSVEGAHRDARRTRSMHRGDWQREPVTELDMVDVEGLADELAALYFERCRSLGVSPEAIRVSAATQCAVEHSGAVQYSGG